MKTRSSGPATLEMTTPKVGKVNLNKKKRNADECKENYSPKKQKLSSTNEDHRDVCTDEREQLNIHDIIRKVKTLFRTSATVELVGRDEQKKSIEKFIAQYPLKRRGHSLFVSGRPGTGKTAFVSNIIEKMMRKNKNIKTCSINCMTAGSNPKSIFQKIYTELTGKTPSIASSVELLEDKLSKGFTFIFLDEIDQLVTADQNVLYRIFEWPNLPKYKCAIIGVANAMDLVQRLLPKLKSKNYSPDVLSFPSYTSTDIKLLIQSRLDSLQEHFPENLKPSNMLMQDAAIELCARKVAAYGDFRKALDICRQAFDELEKDVKSNKELTPKVTVKHVMKVLDASFGSGNPTIKKILGLTPHSKIILSLLGLIDKEKRKGATSCTIDSSIYQTFDIYCNLQYKMQNFPELSKSEFCDLLMNLDSVGLINIRPVTSSATSTPGKPSVGTPKVTVSRKAVTPKSKKIFPSTTPKGFRNSPASMSKKDAIANPMNILILNASEEEILTGVKSNEFLVDLLKQGIPQSCLVPRYFGDLSDNQ